jgi:hypothetical protein
MTDPTPLDIVVISESQRQRDAVHQAQQGLTNTRVRQVTHPAELPGLKEPADIIICDKSVLGEVNDNVGRLKRDGKPIPTLVFEPPRPGAPHNFSDWEALIGIFRAIAPSGEVYESGMCFLPDVALGMITGQLNAGAVGVDFAFRLYAVLDENSPVGFSYRAEPLLNTVDNPLDRIAKLLTAPKMDDAPVIPDPLIKAAPVESKEKK